MKSLIRIGGALVLGIVIIFGALYTKNTHGTEAVGIVSLAPAPTRDYIENKDMNGDGVPDWQNALESNVFKTVAVPPSAPLDIASATYTPPTTFTGKFSEAFFQDYMEGKIKGTDFSDPSKFVGDAVTAIEKNTMSKRHNRLELRIVPSSSDSIRTYGNRVVEITRVNSTQSGNEALILQKALAENNPEILALLEPIRSTYQNIISDTLHMDVPEAFIDEHIALLNAYESIYTDIEAMQLAFTDPLYSLARVKGHRKDADSLILAYQNIEKILHENEIFYTNDEPGAWLYNFDMQ